ncbi:hypothetical protein PF010_g27750 [Phytophthora fragariae]|uniref:Uncharacterized protein n=1 Tax=Phytophthora fragariae TaxID=53985 RepID=A0A6A3PZH7_9STRA|nr:hypothetical protein PF003_g32069 [Phytophthora fragariae]KAE8930585.1 hypothetical protein PF009_g19327 [Phytophthora fragariae]KAE9065853.1 hypothetical protein PF007_g28702 [Phytophthora fragariae]KAE9066724.1 hypothetical protein PF010_g27750 [Phytophthora fragariae]KAE9077771.1 hypothetical protein PF006_g27854 [Phytophthora fragariae]
MTAIYPVTEEYLLPDAHIVDYPAFESAVVEVCGLMLRLNVNLLIANFLTAAPIRWLEHAKKS